MKKIIVFIVAGVVSILMFAGCAGAVHTMVKKSDLDVQTKMSETIFLDPVSPDKRTVFIQIRNTSDKDIDIRQEVQSAISARGYQVIDDPEKANFMLQANILQVGKTDLREVNNAFISGYGGALGGAIAGAAIAGATGYNSARSFTAGGLIGGVLGTVGDALVEDVVYSMITDIQLRQRASEGEVITQKELTVAKQGSSSGLVQAVEGSKTNWKIYRSRILSTANKVNLEFAEAKPALVNGLSHSLGGLF